jgi:hypothetical protein
LLNVISSFFGWAKRSEGHRISGINYSKLHRWISIELAIPREQRMPAKYFLKEVRTQVDRLNETSPAIPPNVINKFQMVMRNVKDDVSLPEICNQIHSVIVYPGSLKHHDEKLAIEDAKEPMLRPAAPAAPAASAVSAPTAPNPPVEEQLDMKNIISGIIVDNGVKLRI